MENKKNIIPALLNAQKEMGNAVKSSTNPFFKSKYSDLNSVREAVMPLLNENGIVVLQLMVTIDGSEYINTVLMHESGESIESHTKIICKSQNDPQAYGSGVTYARRYGLQSFMSIGADDDDGQKATTAPKQLTEIEIENGNLKLLQSCTTSEELKVAFSNIKVKTAKVVALKEELKVKLTNK